MNTILKPLALAGTLCAALFCASPLMSQTIGQWDFNSGNLAQSPGATLGDLQYADTATSSQTAFGSTTAFSIPNINGTSALVMRFPIATNGMGYLMPTPPAANGGGSAVNEWTMLMDVLYPATSDFVSRPIIDTDGSVFEAGPDFIVSATDGVGSPPSGPYQGTINPNTWYRIGIAVTAKEVDIYVNGVQVGANIIPGAPVDDRFALSTASTALILGTTLTSAGLGYVNSIQLRDSALNAGQMQALGGPSAAGIPQTIPPVPAFIQTRTPAVNATGVGPLPNVDVVLNQGDTIVNSSSLKLFLDGAIMASTVTPTPPTYDISASVTTILEPNSIHTLSLVWQDSVAGANTNTWSFTVANYQNVSLPTPFYFESFDELSENVNGPTPLPPGWTVVNQTWPPTSSGYDLDVFSSDTYKDWVLISSAREASWANPPVHEPADRTDLPPIVLNGKLLALSDFLSNGLMWAESDQLSSSDWGQYQEMYTADINCTGKTNVYVAFNSFYEQNQDNLNAVEYSINQGASWLPVRYLFCTFGNGEQSDIYYTNGVIDVGATFSTVDPNRNWAPWPAGCTGSM